MAYIKSGQEFDKQKNHDKIKAQMETMENKPYLLNIPAPLYKKVKRKMIEEEKNLREIILEYLNIYISE